MNKGNIYNKNKQVLINGKNILNEEQNKTFDKLFDMVYPVGSVYMSTNSTSPAELFGGTWTKIESKFLWATVNSPMAIGGSETTDNHKLTITEMPSHTHTGIYFWGSSRGLSLNSGTQNGFYIKPDSNAILAGDDVALGTGKTGGGQGHSHTYMPPYFDVYMWYRTA